MKALLFIPFIAILLVSCTTSRSSTTSWNYDGHSPNLVQMADGYSVDEDLLSKPTVKRVYVANGEIVYRDLNDLKKGVDTLLAKYDSYLVFQSNYTLTLRVSVVDLDSLLKNLSILGEVNYVNKSVNDITQAYTNDSIRLKNAMVSRDRYLDLLKQAKDVKEIILIEKELERLNTTIESLNFSLESKNKNVMYSKVHINLKEKVKPGLLGYVGIGLYKSVKWLFIRG